MQLGHLEAPLRILFLFHTDTYLNGLSALVKTAIFQECGISSSKEASSKTANYINNNSSCTNDIKLQELTIPKTRSRPRHSQVRNQFLEKYCTMLWVQHRQRDLIPHSKVASHCYLSVLNHDSWHSHVKYCTDTELHRFTTAGKLQWRKILAIMRNFTAAVSTVCHLVLTTETPEMRVNLNQVLLWHSLYHMYHHHLCRQTENLPNQSNSGKHPL